jgi:superfamily II DNA/RNA helicase
MKSQVLRTDSKQVEETLDDFVKGKFNILITVPIVFGRGVHVDRIQLVINYGVSSLVPRQTVMTKDKYYARYKHQIGRTGRGLETGVALTLLESDQDLLEEVKDACLEILSQEGQAANIENLSENQDLALGKDLYFDFATLFTPEDGKTLTRRIADTQKIFDLRKTIRVFQARISRLEEVTQALDTQYKENESTQIFAEYVLRKGELDDFRDKLDTAKHSLQILTNRF